MNILKSKKISSDEPTVKSRRSFLWKMSAGASAALASAATFGNSSADNKDDLFAKLIKLEEEKKIRALHKNFENLMNQGQFDDVQNLFADNAQVIFNGGVFKNRKGLNRLFENQFKQGVTGKSMQPAPGFEVAADQQQEALELAADNLSATALFPYSIQVGTPLESDSSLTEMARLQGEGIQTWWEGGNYKVSYVKDAKNKDWLINKLEYLTLSRADYREGRSYAQAISVSQFSTIYPADRGGPDKLV